MNYVYEDSIVFAGNKYDEVHSAIALKSWVLADKLCMSDWANKIMDLPMHIFGPHGRIFWPYEVSWVVENTNDANQLFKFVIDQFTWHTVFRVDMWMNQETNDEDSKNHYRMWFEALCSNNRFPNAQFVWEILRLTKEHEKNDETQKNKGIRKKEIPVPDPSEQGCKYHVHAVGVQCERGG